MSTGYRAQKIIRHVLFVRFCDCFEKALIPLGDLFFWRELFLQGIILSLLLGSLGDSFPPKRLSQKRLFQPQLPDFSGLSAIFGPGSILPILHDFPVTVESELSIFEKTFHHRNPLIYPLAIATIYLTRCRN